MTSWAADEAAECQKADTPSLAQHSSLLHGIGLLTLHEISEALGGTDEISIND